MEAAVNFMESTMTPHVCHAKMSIVLGVNQTIKDVGNAWVDMGHLMVYVLLVMILTVWNAPLIKISVLSAQQAITSRMISAPNARYRDVNYVLMMLQRAQAAFLDTGC